MTLPTDPAVFAPTIPTFSGAPNTALPTPPESAQLARRRLINYDSYSYEPSSRWVRAVRGATAVVDSRFQLLVWERGVRGELKTGKLPSYAFPSAHVRTDLLRPSSDEAAAKAAVNYYSRPSRHAAVAWFDLTLPDGQVLPNAAWKYTAVPGLEDYFLFRWTSGLFDWYEESERVHTHPRDSQVRTEVIPSTRSVQVYTKDSERRLLADSTATRILFERGIPARFYFPPADVKFDELVAVPGLVTSCPYKGYADKYWHIKGDTTEEKLAWAYSNPLHQVEWIKDYVGFLNESVELVVDGGPFTEGEPGWIE
ncbi:uncharacterized protein LOC62_04G006367 [Vanrija pseudolonga]|uniref:DUF427 domain-containing protein n=1 Tax=Vanrija pseudolonga TaxID=143232 RepID=A0AAF0YFJ1_9TREE|nr:hypothetical protein LOC62_04G006367 [Vanrija pseudolonga]